MKKLCSWILVLVMLFGLTACTGTPTEDVSNTEQPVATEPGSDADSDAENVNDDKFGGTLNIAINADCTGIAPWTTNGNTTDLICSWPMLESLFTLDSEGKIVCFLAESYTTDPENLTYTIKLRDNIYFSDGSKLTAEVAKWNLELARERSKKAPNLIGELVSVDVIDDLTIQLNLSAWNSCLPYGLARECGYMYSKEAYDELGEAAFEVNPAVTGPFVQTTWERDIKHEYVRNENYWGGDVYLDGVNITIYKTGLVAQAALESGELDVWYNTDFSANQALEEKGYVIATGSVWNTTPLLCYNSVNETEPFHDIRVRQAISYAIDAEELMNTFYYGYGEAGNQFCVGDYYYSEDVKGYPHDVEKAKALLAEAGYPDGFDTTLTALSSQTGAVTIIKDQLAEVGINVELNIMELSTYAVELIGWEHGMLYHPSSCTPCVPTQLASMFCQGLSGQVLGLTSMEHPDSVDEYLRACLAAENDEDQLKYLNLAQVEMIDTYCMYTPVGQAPLVFVKSPKLHDDGINEACFYSATLSTAWKEK